MNQNNRPPDRRPQDNGPQDRHELELMAGHVLGDLSEEEQAKFDELELGRHDHSTDELAKTAAALHLVFENSNMESMPDQLRAKILADARTHLNGGSGREVTPHAPADIQASVDTHATTDTSPSVRLLARQGRSRARETFAWLAFAASFVVAIVAWNQSPPEPTPLPTVAELRDRLIRDAADVEQIEWAAGKTPFAGQVEGDVVWSNASQEGFMRFVGMPVNDPTIEQYQLWIVDPQRDERPIDGGVFNISSEGEAIIPIDAKLAVVDPAAFAITIEQPGGVVVSTQERLPLIAAVQ